MISKIGILWILAVILLSTFISAESRDLVMDNIRFIEDRIIPGKSVEVLYTLDNTGDTTLKDLEVNFYLLPEYDKLNILAPDFRIKKSDREFRRQILDIPYYSETGYQLMYIIINGDNFQRTKLVEVYIG